MVHLRAIDESNRDAVEALEVSPEQQRFVSNVPDSIAEAGREPDGRAVYWAIYVDETPVGFVMVSDEVGGPGYFPQYLWKLFIDQRYQGRGYGTAALDLIADYFRRRPEVEIMRTSCACNDGGAPAPASRRSTPRRRLGETCVTSVTSTPARFGGEAPTPAPRSGFAR